MHANSLAFRLFLAATVLTIVILAVSGGVLSSFYRQAVERAFDRRLGVYLRTLIADVAAPDDPNGKFPQTVSEPLFELPLSGWYWQVTRVDTQQPEVRSSRSLWDGSLGRLAPSTVSTIGGVRQGYVTGPEEQKLRLVERTVDLGDEGGFLVAVAGDAAEIDEEIRAFDLALTWTFIILGVALLLTTIFQVLFGLAPLKRISERLAAIRSGTAERLEGNFPVEIAQLARETNALIEANRGIVERARTHVGNLAHALKTPLSVMVNEASARAGDPLAVKVQEQSEIMRDQISRHLERARIAARMTVVGSLTDVYPVVSSLARMMQKAHHEKELSIKLDAPADIRFRGEKQDLEEMVGNLVDNACKWAQSRVAIEAAQEQHDGNPRLRILVDDDGRGLTASEREQVAQRGLRLDESKPGSGLGLSIVVELARLYGGELVLGTAPIGGLRAELLLPAA